MATARSGNARLIAVYKTAGIMPVVPKPCPACQHRAARFRVFSIPNPKPRRNKVRNRAFLKQMSIVVVAVVATAVAIQVRPTAEAAPAPLIAGVQVDADSQLLTIQGVNFGEQLSNATLALSPLAVSSWTATGIVASLPAYEAGTYLLMLQRTDGVFSNEFHLTIGAIGPIGPAGPQGPVARATDTLMGLGGGAGLGSGLGEGADTLGRDDAVTRALEDADNTAYGINALRSVETGAVGNAAFGKSALRDLTIGTGNLAFGSGAMQRGTTASRNVAIGNAVLRTATGNENVGIGSNALRDNAAGFRNLAFGFFAGNDSRGSNNIYFSNTGVASDNGTIRIGTPNTHTATYLSGKVHGDGSGLTGVTAVYQ